MFEVKKWADYCCIRDIEETDEYMPKFEPLPLLYFTEDKGEQKQKTEPIFPENIEKITLDFKSKKLFINDITVDSKYDYLDICFDCEDLEIFISNNRGENTSVSYIQEDGKLHIV